MAAKLGFTEVDGDVEKLIYRTLELLEKYQIDYTNFFRNLENEDLILILSNNESWKIDFKIWQKSYKPKAPHLIKKSNPKFILRNYLLQQAIKKAENGDFSEVLKLQKIMIKPFDEQKELEDYAKTPPNWAKELQISCSS
jgi:uncharacterized protein YdiU (UPF0061 family)